MTQVERSWTKYLKNLLAFTAPTTSHIMNSHQLLRGSLARQLSQRYLYIVFVDQRIRPVRILAPYDSILGCPYLVSSNQLGAYPTESKMVIVDLQWHGW